MYASKADSTAVFIVTYDSWYSVLVTFPEKRLRLPRNGEIY